jgi:archaellum biogenesis ATPase FlaH
MIENGRLTDADREKIQAAKERCVVKSQLGLFAGTNGIRPGEVSILLAPKGMGKSTLCKTISWECMASNAKCLHILSEEVCGVYKSNIADTAQKVIGEKAGDKLDLLLFTSMLDWSEKEQTYEGFFYKLNEMLSEHVPDVVIFDNFSTSSFGSMHTNTQFKAINDLRKIASETEMCFVIVMHTVKNTDISKKILSGEDVRGNSNSTNTGSYNYVLTTYFGEKPRAFIFVDKARYHGHINQTYWELMFDPVSGLYVKDKKVDRAELKQAQFETFGGSDVKKHTERAIQQAIDKLSRNGFRS